MYKKIFAIIMALILCIAALTGCGKKQKTTETENGSNEENVPVANTNTTTKDATETTVCHLLTEVTDDFDKIGFGEGYKKSDEKETKGTMFIVFLETSNADRANEIEKVIIKDTQKKTVNVETHTYVLNNNRGCIVLFKTEGTKKASDYFVYLKSYTGKEKYVAIPENENKEIIKSFATQASVAKYGDVVLFNEMPYFILQSGVLSATTYTENNKQYANADMGVVLIPLYHTLERKLTNEDFDLKFYDTDKMGDNGVKRAMKVNDEAMFEKYANNVAGVFAELIVCSFNIVIENQNNIDSYIARRNYVINNTWLQQVTNKDVLYKIASITE